MDARLRELERRDRLGGARPQDRGARLLELARAGRVDPARLRLAAFAGDMDLRAALGWEQEGSAIVHGGMVRLLAPDPLRAPVREWTRALPEWCADLPEPRVPIVAASVAVVASILPSVACEDRPAWLRPESGDPHHWHRRYGVVVCCRCDKWGFAHDHMTVGYGPSYCELAGPRGVVAAVTWWLGATTPERRRERVPVGGADWEGDRLAWWNRPLWHIHETPAADLCESIYAAGEARNRASPSLHWVSRLRQQALPTVAQEAILRWALDGLEPSRPNP